MALRFPFVLAGIVLLAPATVLAEAPDTALQQAVANPARTSSFVARDQFRKPYEVLRFFGIKAGDTVVEISPGAGGYWTEILAPYLAGRGVYYAAQYPQAGGSRPHQRKYFEAFRAKLDANPTAYGKVKVTEFGKGAYDIAPPGSADLVVTFRNLHNWMSEGYADEAMAAFFKALKKGGVLGIEEHRGRTDKVQDPQAADGYVRQDYTIEMAKRAGFVFDGSSEILANPRDTKDYPAGVWTLPPSLRLGDKDRARYIAIGESDGFLLRFRKP